MEYEGIVDRLKKVVKKDIQRSKDISAYRFRKEHPKLAYITTGEGAPQKPNFAYEEEIIKDKIKKKKRRTAAKKFIGDVAKGAGKKFKKFGEEEARGQQRSYSPSRPSSTPQIATGPDWRLGAQPKKLWWQD
jgi:hypothetical protein